MNELDEKIESWEGFHWTFKKERRKLWEEMTQQVRHDCTEAVELSGKPFVIEPFFMALLLFQ